MPSADFVATPPSNPAAKISLLPESRQALRIRKRLTRRSRISVASVFVPSDPNLTPEQHFPLQTVYTRTSQPRFVNLYDSREILLTVDGSCLNNGSKDPTMQPPAGGCSFSYKGAAKSGHTAVFPLVAPGQTEGGIVGFPLEQAGPSGEKHNVTSNRAKLRAVIAALEFREWQQEGWRSIVVATDLEYVVFGATRWLAAWAKRGWKKRKSGFVTNRDLWEELHGIIDRLALLGTNVSFWLIRSRSPVGEASALVQDTKCVAREAATVHVNATAQEFTRLCGIEV
ncbi:hypothetical protein GGR57DRAFT_464118 [Xylariaceae sp. FL1272]|nr:hypothetical protein GGR57DRAFT_464118 [Xylariaceae sp. FL1272]